VIDPALDQAYADILRAHLAGGGEAALARAYELGRSAAASGVGIVELVAVHGRAVRAVLGAVAAPPAVDQLLVEALSPFEMTHRGFREANARLEAANRELEAFSYSVSHDLRAPLRAIAGFAQLLQRELAGQLDARSRDHLDRVLAAADRMNGLIDALLELSHVSRASFQRRRVDLSAAAAAVVDDLRHREPERAVDVSIEPGLAAEADPRLARLLLDNLIGNAWKFTSRTPAARIEVGAIAHDGATAFFVRDNGAGFDPALADRMFAPFQRMHSVAEFPGTGIGLATVKRIIDRHGGTVWAESAVGRGATFYFTLA
jgi:light-regulated signal transduction histidine kinase (bacteriophytochrome)